MSPEPLVPRSSACPPGTRNILQRRAMCLLACSKNTRSRGAFATALYCSRYLFRRFNLGLRPLFIYVFYAVSGGVLYEVRVKALLRPYYQAHLTSLPLKLAQSLGTNEGHGLPGKQDIHLLFRNCNLCVGFSGAQLGEVTKNNLRANAVCQLILQLHDCCNLLY